MVHSLCFLVNAFGQFPEQSDPKFVYEEVVHQGAHRAFCILQDTFTVNLKIPIFIARKLVMQRNKHGVVIK